MRAAAAAAASAATRPSEPPPPNYAPQRPATATTQQKPTQTPNTNSGGGTPHDSAANDAHKHKEADKRQAHASKSERLKEEVARQRAAAEAARRQAEADEEAKYAGMTPEEKQRAQHRERERKAAEARTAERRAKTGYANYVSGDASRDNRTDTNVGGQATSNSSRKADASSTPRNQSPPTHSYPQEQESSKRTDAKPSTEQFRDQREQARKAEELDAARKHKQKKKTAEVICLPIPSGVTGSALDHTSAQLEWQILLPLHVTAGTKEAALFAAIKTELAYREVMQYVKADGAVYSSTGQEWTMGSMLLSGEKVIKKNLLPGHKYEFKMRFVVPQTTGSAAAVRSADRGMAGGLVGAWSESTTVSLPARPAGSEFMSPGPDNDKFRERSGGGGTDLKRNNSGLAEEVPDGMDGNFSAHIQNIRSMKGSAKTPVHWGGNRVADSTASLYGRRFGSATSLPEEVADDDDIVPDQWVDDGSDSEGEDSPTRRHPFKREQHKGAAVMGDGEEEEDLQAKWYQLMPPDSHVGTGKYKHPVRVARRDDASVVGYVSTASRVKARKKTSEWMQVQVHFTTASAVLNADVGEGDGSQALPYGWMKRNEWNHRLQRDHEMLRHIPESYKEMKRFNHVTTSIPEEEEGLAPAEEGSTPLAAKATVTKANPKEWQQDVRTRRAEDNAKNSVGVSSDYDDSLLYSKVSHGASGNIDIWYEQVDEGGYVFYYNASTGESRWEPPEWVEELDETSGARYLITKQG